MTVKLALTPPLHANLSRLAHEFGWGADAADVIRFTIVREIARLQDEGRLPDQPQNFRGEGTSTAEEVLNVTDPDPRSQADKIRDLARELECDEDEAAFKKQVRRVAKAPKQSSERDGQDKR